MKKLTLLLFLTFPMYVVADSLTFGVNGDNADGCDIPDVFVEYEFENDSGVSAHGRVHNKGNRICEDTLSADLGIESDFGLVSVEFGYDRRGVTALNGNDFYYGSIQAETAVVNLDLDVSDANVEIGLDLVKQVPRMAIETDLGFGVALEADSTFYDMGALSTFRLSWSKDIDESWGVEAFVQTTKGVLNAPDGIKWTVGPPPDGPDDPHAFGLGITRKF